MRKKSTIIFMIILCCMGCDRYKDDVSPTIEYTAQFIPDEPVVVRLNSFISPQNARKFIVSEASKKGDASLIEDSFLKYTPTGANSDQLILDVFDENDQFLAKAKVSLVPSATNCGIGSVDKYTLHANEALPEMTVVSNELVCEEIGIAMLAVTSIENTEGLSFTIPPPGPDGPVEVLFSYTPPDGFRGTVKAIYSIGINVKPEFLDAYLNLHEIDEILKNAHYFKFFVTGMVEIEVID